MRALLLRYLLAAIATAVAPPLLADEAAAPAVSLSGQIQPLFDQRCVACHLYGAAQADLVLEEGDAHANLVGVKSTQSSLLRVAPGAPEQSYLLHKLRGTHASVGGTGVRMPFGDIEADPLPPEEETMIKAWIEQGAPDN